MEFTFLVNELPNYDFDWIDIWEGECKILCHAGEGAEEYEYYEDGTARVSVRKTTDEVCTSIDLWISNNAELPKGFTEAVKAKFGEDYDFDYPNWGGDGEEGQYCSYCL